MGGSETSNDIWCLNTQNAPLKWEKIEVLGQTPKPRWGHKAVLCTAGVHSGEMIIFGGFNVVEDEVFADIWSLHTPPEANWEWVPMPIRNGSELCTPRLFHTASVLG